MLLRYPGGKSRGQLAIQILDLIEQRFAFGRFGELFFGGGGITFGLLKRGVIQELVLNELDSSLADLWTRVIQHPKGLSRRVKDFEPSVDQFVKRRDKILAGDGDGFDSLVVNRLSHAGRGVMAGPQGGYEQQGKYKIDCRWNAEKLIERIFECHHLFKSVKILGNKCFDRSYKAFVDSCDFLYLDPPYWEIGQQMYHFSFCLEEHQELFDCLKGRKNWVLSYNNHPEVVQLYNRYHMITTSTSGNGGQKKNSEVIIYA